MDAISEVEKLNATQFMAMIISPSTVNVMLNEEDCCFQCQEPDILHNITLTLGTMSVMNMVISWTVHMKYLLQELQQHITNHTKVTMPD